jgi:hypothetical protein
VFIIDILVVMDPKDSKPLLVSSAAATKLILGTHLKRYQ